VDHFKKEI